MILPATRLAEIEHEWKGRPLAGWRDVRDLLEHGDALEAAVKAAERQLDVVKSTNVKLIEALERLLDGCVIPHSGMPDGFCAGAPSHWKVKVARAALASATDALEKGTT
jgi:hypothetical protein